MFIRSMAAGERLGGLAPATRAAAQALAAAFDVVVIETVGVGQSETEVAEAADTVAVIVQPGSGDALQFLKAGIMEVPDVLVVTKADLGAVATARGPRPARRAALARRARHAGRRGLERPPGRAGIDELIAALDAHRAGLDLAAARVRARRLGALADFVAEHGERGLRDARRPPRGRALPRRAAAGGRASRRCVARARSPREGLTYVTSAPQVLLRPHRERPVRHERDRHEAPARSKYPTPRTILVRVAPGRRDGRPSNSSGGQVLNRSRRIAAAAVGVDRARAGAAAQAATRNVVAGPPARCRSTGRRDSNAYYRKQVTIHVGDNVRWKFNGFHTVTFPAKGKDPPPFIGQDPAAPRSPASTTLPASRSGSTARPASR